MKTILTALLVALTGLELLAQTPMPAAPSGPGQRRLPRYTQPLPGAARANTLAKSSDSEETIPAGLMDWTSVDINQALDVYAKLVNRSLLRGNLPDAKIIFHAQTPLTKAEAIQAIEALLAMNNVSLIPIGDKFVKVVTSAEANGAGGELDSSGGTNLPSMGSYVTHITQLKYVKPSVMIPLITPFAKLPNSVFGIDDNGILVIRDYAENVKRMLEMIAKIDVSVPAEYVSEVIPIRYAKVDEIAAALNSLGGGGGGSTVSIGTAPSSSQISGLANRSSGIGGMNAGGINGAGGTASPFANRSPTPTPNGTPASGATSFQDRLRNIINRANPSGGGGNQQDQIQLFGETKIIPNESSSTLLIYATRQDMAMIKEIIAKLDVPLAQVLIEAIIMDVTIGHSFNLGTTVAQNPKVFANPNNSTNILDTFAGAGGMNNGASLLNFLTQAVGTNGTSSFGSSLPGGFSYFGNLGPTFDFAVQAAQSDSHASIIQRPRIQTSQAKQAQFFVGETKPYVTSTYNNAYSGGYGGSSYSQLSVGVELDVTPFINPDGEVTMEIQQEIDDFNGTTPIAGVGDVPNTIKRTLNTTITVRDKDTVMLGGFIKSDKSTSKSGVPFLQDIPLFGNLFTSRNDAKDRKELIVLMRPTVLKTPKMAAENTIKESQRLPGVSGAAADDAAYEHKLVEAERQRELSAARTGSNTNGFFNLLPVEEPTNSVPPGAMEDAAPQSPATMADPAPASTLLDPSGEAMADAKAMAGLTPAQLKKLDAVDKEYLAGKLTADEYKEARKAILTSH